MYQTETPISILYFQNSSDETAFFRVDYHHGHANVRDFHFEGPLNNPDDDAARLRDFLNDNNQKILVWP